MSATGLLDFTLRLTHTYCVQGAIAVPSGATNFLPPFPLSVFPTQRLLLVGVWLVLRNGTCNISIQQNGSGTGLADLTNKGASTTNTAYYLTTYQEIVDGDLFAPIVSSPAGTPDGLTVGYIVDHIITINLGEAH